MARAIYAEPMQIEVRDGSRILWVEEFGCFVENGELAFSYHELPDIIAPDWYGSPEDSALREERKTKNPERPAEELRSMHASATEIVSFYRERILRGGLTPVEDPVVDHSLQMTDLSRLEPGFYAENDGYRLSLDVFEHRGISFWRVKHGPKLPSEFRSRKEPKHLIFVREVDGKAILRNPETNDELWAHPNALTNGPSRHAQDPKHSSPEKVPISWRLLPDWIQVEIAPGTESTASSSFSGDTLAGFSCMKLSREIRTELEQSLDQLDTFEFDATGLQSPDHNYYLRPMTGGRHIEVRITERSGDQASLTFVNTCSGPMLYAYYKTQRTLQEFLSRS